MANRRARSRASNKTNRRSTRANSRSRTQSRSRKAASTRSRKAASSRSRSAAKRKTKRRSSQTRTQARSSARIKTIRPQGHWNTYHQLHRQVNQAWNQFQACVENRANPETVAKAKNYLMLLLGECNYMARQCKQLAAQSRRR